MLRQVWTLPVRMAHWSVAALVVYTILNDSGDKLHRYAGYVAAAIVCLRLLHGLRGSAGPARVALPGLSAGIAHLREMRSRKVKRPYGHNPLGAAMSLLLWTLVLLLALSGWVSRWDRYWGEDWPIVAHAILAYGLMACVVLHLLGVVASSVLEKQNLARGMVTGKKIVDDEPAS